ncbi:MAG: restriction endonuclease [bacterium]|nr:restriction endonuclease [bacterium]
MLVDLKTLSSDGFEDLMDDLFRAAGWDVAFHAGTGPDGGRDLIIERTDATHSDLSRDKYVVQCKRYATIVGKPHVQDIVDTVKRFGGGGFILAVTSQVSESLASKLRDLTEQGTECVALRPYQIYEMLRSNEDVFLKYFPREFGLYCNLLSRFTVDSISALLNELFRADVSDEEREKLRRHFAIHDYRSIDDAGKALSDPSLASSIESAYQGLLSRSPSLYELILQTIALSRVDAQSRDGFLTSHISNMAEYLSKVRFVLSFSDYPTGTAYLDEIDQRAYGFRTYHRDYLCGRLSIEPSNLVDVRKVLRIESTAESEFRVVGQSERHFRKTRILAVDFLSDADILQMFVLVRTNGGRVCFVQYIEGDGTDTTIKDSSFEYTQIYSRAECNGPVRRKEMRFAEDFSRMKSEEVAEYLGMYIGVKGSVTIFRFILAAR